jgi:hypothetical protein
MSTAPLGRARVLKHKYQKCPTAEIDPQRLLVRTSSGFAHTKLAAAAMEPLPLGVRNL